jgi:hypothetical protein
MGHSGYKCPRCDEIGTYRNNIRTHLMDNPPGHNLTRDEADRIIADIEGGASSREVVNVTQVEGRRLRQAIYAHWTCCDKLPRC